ncbi:hypothetical protein G6F62_013058 [Rhizopus arrhizus]|nr:hypothetical protein G6F62_013058 [Rhizopus arrhizus]KAG1370361.1 hypothetical protein G6F61_012101 [Rhizopus arrhizus]
MQTAIAPTTVKDRITKHWDSFGSHCTWKTLAVAAATRESSLFLGNDHLLFEAPQSVVEPPFPMTAPAPEPAGPTPMELDAFTHRRSN